MLPSKEDVLLDQRLFDCTPDRQSRIQRAVCNRPKECDYHDATLTRMAIEGYRRRNQQLIEALQLIENLNSLLRMRAVQRVEDIDSALRVGQTPKDSTQGLHEDAGDSPSVEEFY